MHKYIIMGVQGSGKGTQAQLLAQDLDLVHINVGDIFRWNIQHHTKLGARVKRLIAEGQLLPDDVVMEVVRHRLHQHDWNYGFIVDGFPRTAAQAEFFLENYDVDAVIIIEVPDAVVRKRISSRLVCSRCGLDYNLIYHRPKKANICDVCGGKLIRRQDDNKAAINARLKDYYKKTAPIIDLFSRTTRIIRVDGTKSPDVVQRELRRKIGLNH